MKPRMTRIIGHTQLLGCKMKIFVYGTLKKGFGNHYLLEESRFLGKASLTGNYRMISLDAFPMVVESQEEYTIYGELYEIDKQTLVSLDMLEGYPHFYDRDVVTVIDDIGKSHDAYMYIGHNNDVFYFSTNTVKDGNWTAK